MTVKADDCRSDPRYIEAENFLHEMWQFATGQPGRFGQFTLEGIYHDGVVTQVEPTLKKTRRFGTKEDKPKRS